MGAANVGATSSTSALFKNFNFAVSSIMLFLFGALLFSSLVMMPQFLQTLLGYTAQSAGLVLSGGGLVILLQLPIVGQLTTKVPAKYLIAFGWLCLAVGMYYSTQRLDLLMSYRSASTLRIVQSFGLKFPVCADQSRGLYRRSRRKGNQRLGSFEFHAQHREQRGHIVCDHVAGAARAVSPVYRFAYHTTNYDPAFQATR